MIRAEMIRVEVDWCFGGGDITISFPDGSRVSVTSSESGLLSCDRYSVFFRIFENYSPGALKIRRIAPNAPWSAGSYWNYEVEIDDDTIENLKLFNAAQGGNIDALDKLKNKKLVYDIEYKNALYTHTQARPGVIPDIED